MKKLIALILLYIFITSIPASAAIGSKGLIIENGKELLVLEKGEKEFLNVRDGLTKLFLFKEISYYSDNTIVATVGLHSGILRANNVGTATITAINKSGDAGQIKVIVKTAQKRRLSLILIFLTLLSPVLYFILRK